MDDLPEQIATLLDDLNIQINSRGAFISPPREQHGRDKYETLRKLKKLHRLLHKADREGCDMDKIKSQISREPFIDLRTEQQVLYVDCQNVSLRWENDQSVATVLTPENKRKVDIPFEINSVDTEVTNGITAYHFNEK